MFFHCTGNGCIQRVWFVQNGVLIMHLARDMHKRAIIARIICVLEKTIYGLKNKINGLKKTIYGLTIYGSKKTIYILRLFLQSSLFLIT